MSDLAPDPAVLYIANYAPDDWHDSIPRATEAFQAFQQSHPLDAEIPNLFGAEIEDARGFDHVLMVVLEGGTALKIESIGGPELRMEVGSSGRAMPFEDALPDELQVAWFFAHGDPAGEGRARSRPWTWHRAAELALLRGRRLTKVSRIPGGVALYFGDEGHRFELEPVFEEGTSRPLLIWGWDEWRGHPAPYDQPFEEWA